MVQGSGVDLMELAQLTGGDTTLQMFWGKGGYYLRAKPDRSIAVDLVP